MSRTPEYWIDKLGLQRHPEGGWYRELWRSQEPIPVRALPGRYKDNRSLGTSIYYLITHDSPSHFHVLDSDEIWFWHAGDHCTIHELDDDGGYAKRRLGPDEKLQHHIPHSTYFAAEMESAASYSLFSCVVVPAFSFNGFRMASREELTSRWPNHTELINRLTKP